MRRRAPAAMAVGLFTIIAILCTSLAAAERSGLSVAPAAASADAPGSSGVAGAPVAAVDVEIEWKDSADATYEAAKNRWQKELGLPADPARRDEQLAQRLLKLAHALVERFPAEGEKRVSVYARLARDLAALRPEDRAWASLRQLVEEFPGEVGLAAEALDAIVSRMLEGNRWDGSTDTARTAEYAADRLIALQEAGHLSADHPAVDRAWRLRLAIYTADECFWDALQALERLAPITGRGAEWREREAELYLAAGRFDIAARLLQDVAGRGEWRYKYLAKARDSAPDFPRDLGLEMRWAAVHSRTSGTDTAAVQALLDESAEGQGIMPWEEGRHASVWTLVDRLLAAQKPEVLAPLRLTQERQAADLVERARRTGDPQAMLVLSRRFPWAPAVHEAMVACGEQMLRRGYVGQAHRAFEDVLAHAGPGETRAKAQVGLWLALASETRDRGALQAAFDGVAPDAEFPWMGERAAASRIRERLLAGIEPGEGAAPALAGLAPELVRIPPTCPWDLGAFGRLPEAMLREFPSPLGSLQGGGQRVLVAGPSLLACFGEDVSRPLWWRAPNDVERTRRRVREREGMKGDRQDFAAAPGLFQPAMAGGRVYSRWGAEPSGQALRGVAAFDAATGEIAWSTDDDPAWEEMWPASDPVVADGRVYVLTIQDRFGPILPIHLACLDAASGRLLWQRTLGSQNPGLLAGDGTPYRRDRAIELVRYGSAVTVHRGAVYAVTNLGFAARCDARDGMVEWINTYPRVRLGANTFAILRRMGAPPVVAGDRVVCLPRDYHGLFALDRRSGRLAWEAPLLPAQEAVGLAGGALLVRGEEHLLAVDTASGRVLWDRRFAEGIRGRPALAGGSLYVGTAETLRRLDVRTGGIVEEKPWPSGDPPREFILRGERLLALSDASAGFERPGSPRRPAVAESPPLALPLKHAWWLARPEADVWLPPAGAEAPRMAYLASRGVFECIDMSPQGGPVWQRFVAAAPDEVLWAEGLMILVSGQRLLALDTATGAVRWQCEAPWRARLKKVCPPYLVLAARQNDQPPQQELAVLDLATGRLLWSRPVGGSFGNFRFSEIAWDGRNFRCFGLAWEPGQPCGVEATVRPSDGETVAVRPFLPDPMDRPMRIVLGDGFGFCLTETRALYEFSLAGGAAVRHPADLRELTDRDRIEMHFAGPWLQITRRSPFPALRQWILRRGDPAYELRLEQEGTIWGGAVYTQYGGTATATDLETLEAVVYAIPAVADATDFRGIVDFYVAKDRLWLLSVQAAAREGGPAAMRVDAFDRATGAPLQAQVLPNVFPGGRLYGWRRERSEDENRGSVPPTQVVWTPGAIYVSDPRGFHSLAPGPPAETADSYRYIAAMPSRPLTVDGSLDDWEESSSVPLQGPAGRQGRLYLAHDDANLYVAVRYRDRDFLPRVGAADAAGGDWLEVGLTTNKESRRWTLALGPRGGAVWEGLGDTPLPRGLAGAVRHDPAGGEVAYEMAVPWAERVQSGADARKMGLSVAVWDEDPAGGGPARVLTCGEGLIWRRLLPAAHQPIYLYPLTRKAVETMQAAVDELPDLPESFDYFLDFCALRAEAPAALLDLYAGFMRRHPQSLTAPRLLAFDRALRLRWAENPGPALAALARRAGVPDAVCRRYEKQSQAYLSQWVYVAPDAGYPRSIQLELDDGIAAGPAAWNHRVYWGKPYWNSPKPGAALAERFTPGTWQEARVPLSLFGMSDLPIGGISYSQQGEPRVVWDRSAVVYDGHEEVFLEDALPEGARTGGTWEWLGSPVHSGATAHAHVPPERRYDVTAHWAADFRKPVVLHVGPPPEGPYLSQWIYLDPADPPKSVSLGLHDGRAWCAHAIWGEKTVRGRFMGPRPAAGGWRELRLPLAWTPLAAEPIAGVFFGQDGGRALWDRTALAAGGRERVIVEGEPPPVPPGERALAWAPWLDDHFGGVTPVPGKRGVALACDGKTGYVEAPDSPALEPGEMTIEAWIYLKFYPWGGDLRRWIVGKNVHEETDGHYGLLVKGSGVGAIVNIGGMKADAFEAWSDQGLVSLRRWHHVAMTYDGHDLRAYLDGKPIASTAINRKRTPGSTPLAIGRRQDGYSHFAGAIDEVRLYKQALPDAEVRARFEAAGGPPAGDAAAALAAHWGFETQIVPVDPAAWQWVDQPARSGKRAHTQPPATGFAAHGCLFKEPLMDHLPFDRGRVMAALGRHIPDLGASEQAWQLLGRMLGLEPAAGRRAELCAWFVKAIPDHPRGPDVLKALADACEELRRADPALDVEAHLCGLDLPPEALYAYHRKYVYPGRSYVRDWQVLGPLPNPEDRGRDAAYPPETEGVNLDAGYDGAAGKVHWLPYQSPTGHINMKGLFGTSDHVLAYAACWVRSDAAQPVVLEVGRDDACKVWINRQRVVDAKGASELAPGSQAVRVDLKAGWNEVLVRSEHLQGEWAFVLEFVEATGRGPPQGIEITATPPPKGP